MLTNLDWLILVFIGLSGASLLAICLMFLIKNQIVKKVCFYFLAIQGMALSCMNALSTPISYGGEIALGWAMGALSVAALLLEICGKSEKKSTIARILVTVSVLIGVWNTFLY